MKVVHKQEKLKNVLLYADFGCTTGFAKVAKELVDECAKDENTKIVIFSRLPFKLIFPGNILQLSTNKFC